MNIRIPAALAAAAVLAAAVASVPASAQSSHGRIVVFGASLSDSGNAFALRGGLTTPPDYMTDPLLVPSAPYARGGHHFSNGATWIEQYARSRGLAGSVRPAFASEGEGTNYAVAGARAWEDGLNVNFSAQVDAFLQRFGNAAPPDALYAIEIGGNDVRDAFVVYVSGGGPAGAGAILQQANMNIAAGIQRLYTAGARDFLLWRAPNVGATPALRTIDRATPGAAFLATQLTIGFNAGLDGVAASLSALPGIRIARLDAFALINELSANGAAYGLTNVTDACVTPHVAPYTCDRPDEYLFWDGIHPTRAVHAIVAQRAAQASGLTP